MAVITAGTEAIDRTGAAGDNATKVDFNHPCSGTGKITHVRWYQSTGGSATLGLVRQVSPGVFNTVAHLALGLLGTGLEESDVDFACLSGDLLALYTTGLVDSDTGGPVGSYFVNGDKLVGSAQNWAATQQAGLEWSMDATGESGALPSTLDDSCEGIAAWLDAIEATYVPCVDAWLVANP